VKFVEGDSFASREDEPALRTWWRWPQTGCLVYWVDENTFLSYREHPKALDGLLPPETAIVRRQSENVLVLCGDRRKELEGLTLAQLARYYDASPHRHHMSDDTWAEGLAN